MRRSIRATWSARVSTPGEGGEHFVFQFGRQRRRLPHRPEPCSRRQRGRLPPSPPARAQAAQSRPVGFSPTKPRTVAPSRRSFHNLASARPRSSGILGQVGLARSESGVAIETGFAREGAQQCPLDELRHRRIANRCGEFSLPPSSCLGHELDRLCRHGIRFRQRRHRRILSRRSFNRQWNNDRMRRAISFVLRSAAPRFATGAEPCPWRVASTALPRSGGGCLGRAARARQPWRVQPAPKRAARQTRARAFAVAAVDWRHKRFAPATESGNPDSIQLRGAHGLDPPFQVKIPIRL